ncbi:unnamed protein product, partial [Timema podura]|nr:unnamed protein product [Timema podura]
MELMATFRKLLNSSGFEVLDCFDDHNYNDISVHPTQWILDLLSNNKVKVVIASSKCARKQQRFRNRVSYIKDRCFSPLFLYGLDYITKNNSADMFERCFHVRY